MTETEEVAAAGASLVVHLDAPPWDGARTAAVSSLRFDDADAGRHLLEDVCVRLASRGYGAILGPMEGDTWHRYRAVVRSDGSVPFPMEPVSGPHDVDALLAAGFGTVSRYFSSRAPVGLPSGPAHGIAGVRLEPWDGQGADRLLAYLFDISSASFARNAFYKPIARDAFLAMYLPLVPSISPDMVLFARDADGIVGFLFGFADGQGRAVLKTYASRMPGVGRALADRFHRVAADRGCREVVHALMHADNPSLARSRLHGGEVFREYALMGRRIAR